MLNVQGVPTRPRLALSRHCVVDGASIEQTYEIYKRMTAEVRFEEIRGQASFSWRLHCLPLGPLMLIATENSADLRAACAGTSDTYLLSIPLSEPSAQLNIGGRSMPVVRRKSGVLCAPWQDSEVLSEPNFQVLQLIVPRQYLIDAMRTLTGLTSREITFATGFKLDAPQAAPLLRLLSFIMAEAEHDPPEFDAPGERDRLAETLVFRLLLSQPHSQSALFSRAARSAEPRHVRRAADYIDANFERAVTMAELTSLTGVTARALQLGFRKYRGCSPLDFVRARRLERARVLLVMDDAVQTVSEVARLAGIEHLGRFSVRYRQRFGEGPMHTLARRWKRTG
ncbi:MAG: AraC family transcriptional regulator [Myxococcales bacterium]